MAPWIAHLRVADRFLSWANARELDIPRFVFGSVAPDGGVPVEFGKYDPDKKVTHFGRSRACEFDRFVSDHLMNAKSNAARSFLWGYLTHLIMDDRWVHELVRPIQGDLEGDARLEITRAARNEWINLDKQWLEKNGRFPAWDVLCNTEPFEDEYLVIFPRGAFARLMERVKAHGMEPSDGAMEYRHVSMDDMDRVVESACRKMQEFITKMGQA